MNYPAWQLKKGDPAAETSLAGAGCGVLLRRVLAARGCTEPAAAQAMPQAGPCGSFRSRILYNFLYLYP